METLKAIADAHADAAGGLIGAVQLVQYFVAGVKDRRRQHRG